MRRLSLLACLVSSTALGADFLILGGSASLDYRYISGDNPPSNPSLLGINSLGLEVAAKAVVDIGHGVSFNVKVCAGCHGIEIDQAYGEVMLKEQFNLRAGRINVPFGDFTVRHDPTNFATPSKPLPYAMGDMLYYGPQAFNLGIVPAPYVDNGVEAFGTFALSSRTSLDWSLYVMKGLAGQNDLDFVTSRQYLDNNRYPAGGARLVLTGADWAVGASFMGGTYDPKDTLAYFMAGLDLYARLGPVKLRAEALGRRTDLDPTAMGYPFSLIDTFFVKLGWYAELEWEVQSRLTLVLRSDGLHRLGEPIPGSQVNTTSAGVQRQTVAALFRITGNFAVKADYELWTFVGTSFPTRHVARAALVFGY